MHPFHFGYAVEPASAALIAVNVGGREQLSSPIYIYVERRLGGKMVKVQDGEKECSDCFQRVRQASCLEVVRPVVFELCEPLSPPTWTLAGTPV